MNYFARWGKIYGPFDEKEMVQLQAEGRLSEFSWMWDARTSTWKAVDPAPPPLMPSKGKDKANAEPHVIEAVCHNRTEYLSGLLEKMTETGCEFVSWHPESYPAFGEKAAIHLSLLDVATGEVRNITAWVAAVVRTDTSWRYRLRWSQKPDFSEMSLHQNFS
jgi:hypothetical protein